MLLYTVALAGLLNLLVLARVHIVGFLTGFVDPCILESKIDPEWVPNRIIDADGVKKPLDRPLDRSWRGLEGSWSALGAANRARPPQDELSWSSTGGPAEARGGIREG